MYRFLLVFSVLVFGILLLTNADLFVRSDEFYYYHTAKTIVDEGSFVTSEKPAYWDSAAPWTKGFYNGNYISVTSPGTSIVNVPALFISKIVGNTFNYHNDYFIAYNGHTIFDGIFLLLNSTIFFFGALWYTAKILRKLGFSKRKTLYSILAVTISSYVLWYVILLPIFTHVYEMFFISMLIYHTLVQLEKSSRTNLIMIGIAMGFLFLIRPIYAVIILLTLGLIAVRTYSRGIKKLLIRFSLIFVSSLPFLIIYGLYNLQSYGKLITSGYAITGSSDFDFSKFSGFNILFSLDKGWLVYSPIILFSLIGLFLFYKRSKLLAVYLLSSILLIVMLYGFWPSWWGGGSFGSRFLIFAVPICSIGLANFWIYFRETRWRRLSVWLSILFVIYSGSILLLYRITPSISDFQYPILYFYNQYLIAKDSSSIKEFLETNLKNIQGGSTIPAIVLGRMDYLLKPEVDYDVITLKNLTPPNAKPSNESIQAFIINKETKTVYEFEVNSNLENLPSIDCSEDCKINDKLLERSDLTTLSGYEFVGQILDLKYDLYIQTGRNVILRGNPKLVDLSDFTIKLFN